MVDLLTYLYLNAAKLAADTKREDFVLVIGENHRAWFHVYMTPITNFAKTQETPDHIAGFEIIWSDEHPNMFLFVERKHVEIGNG